MTEWSNPEWLKPAETTSTSKPCPECPVIVWDLIRDPASLEAQHEIRSEERKLTLAPFRQLLNSDLMSLYATLRGLDLGKIGDEKARNIIGLFLHSVTQIVDATDEAA